MRMYLDDLNNPEELPLLAPDTRNVQWLDNKGEPVDDETSALANRYTEYAMMCSVGGVNPIPYNDWLVVQQRQSQKTTTKSIDPGFLKDMDAEQSLITRYNEYVDICEAGGNTPKNYEEWSLVGKKCPDPGTQTALISLLREESCNSRSEKDKLICELEDTILELESARDGLREANSALALRCQELVDSYENQKSELWKKIEDLRDRVQELTSEPEVVRERDDLLCRLESLENEVCRRKNLMKELKSQQEELLQTRHELILENEELTSELETITSAVGQRTTPANQPLFPHYYRQVPNATHVDIYWALKAWDVADPCVAHAVKKLMCLGQRGVKNNLQDLEEARNSLNRAIELEQTK